MNKYCFFINKYWPAFLTGVFVLACVFAYFFMPAFESFVRDAWQVLTQQDQVYINQYFNDFGFWGPIVLILFFTLQMFLIIIPSWLPIIAAVMIYGFWSGILISGAGILLASSCGFYIGSKLGSSALDKMIDKKKHETLDYWIRHYGFWSIVLFRLSPFLSNDAISFVAGMLSMSYRKFITATFVGITPLIVAIAYFSKDTDTLKTGMYWIGGAGLLLYGMYIYIDHNKRKRNVIR